MYAVVCLVLWLGIFSGIESSLVSNGIVFTGEIIKIGEDRTVLVQVIKTLLTQENVKVPSTVTLQNFEQDESSKGEKGVYIFYVLPLEKDVFEVLHYWSVKQEEFSDVESSSLEGRVGFYWWGRGMTVQPNLGGSCGFGKLPLLKFN